MYNDYYLQEISGKITTTNNNLNNVIQNQQRIIAFQESGDKYYQQLLSEERQIKAGMGICTFVVVFILLFNFIVRCWK